SALEYRIGGRNFSCLGWNTVVIGARPVEAGVNWQGQFCYRLIQSLLLFSRVGLIKRGAKSLCKFQCVIVCPKVHEEKPRLIFQHVAVQRGDGDSVLAKC